MRCLTETEIETIGNIYTPIAKIKLDGIRCVDDNGRLIRNLPFELWIRNCSFHPDPIHIAEAGSDGLSMARVVILYDVESNSVKAAKYYTQCTERELFMKVGEHMGNVYMGNYL